MSEKSQEIVRKRWYEKGIMKGDKMETMKGTYYSIAYSLFVLLIALSIMTYFDFGLYSFGYWVTLVLMLIVQVIGISVIIGKYKE